MSGPGASIPLRTRLTEEQQGELRLWRRTL